MRTASAVLAATFVLGVATAAPAATSCDIGRVVGEQTLLTPQPGSFFGVDALNPDVVKRGDTYYLFFSGNPVHSFGGDWRTGVATSKSPTGPFTVQSGLLAPFVNGGTAVWRDRFWQATYMYDRGPVLLSGPDGFGWNTETSIPAPPGWPTVADFYLQPKSSSRLRVYMLVRRSETIPAGGNIASMDYDARRNRWSRFRVLFGPSGEPWENRDLGEPAFVHLAGHDYLFYTATADADATRTIGLARRSGSSWRRCSNQPVIGTGASWGPRASVDPSVLAEGNRMFVYYGGGTGTSIAADLGGAIGVRVYELPSARAARVTKRHRRVEMARRVWRAFRR